jgi:hypothetical protein
MLRKDPFDTCYVIQYSKRNAKGVSAKNQVMEIFEIFHRIITSFDCLIGLEPMYSESESDAIYDTGSLYAMVDETYVSNITKDKYMDALQFTFRIVTRADMVNMLGRVKDFNIDDKKTLADWLKEQQIYLFILWKAPPSFEEVAIISGPTRYTNTIMALKEIALWIHSESESEYETSQFRLKWRKRQIDDKSVSVLVLSADPSISDKIATILNKKNEDLEPMTYYETYDYRYFAPTVDIGEESYHTGIEAQLNYISQRRCAEVKGINCDLFTFTPKREGKWADEETICDKLLDRVETLFVMSGTSHISPFTKVNCTGKCWVFSWRITDEETAKYYLDYEFQKQLARWTESPNLSLTIEYPFEQDCTSEDTPESINESETNNNNPNDTTDELGRTIRKSIKKVDISKNSNAALTAQTSQCSTNREMTSNASSSLTAPTVQLQGHGNWTQPPNVPNPYSLPDTGQLMNIQQFTQLMKLVERQNQSAMSNHINTVLAFHDPDRGIKKLITEEIRRAVRIEMALNREPQPSTYKGVTLPRVRSHEDIPRLAAHQAPRMIVQEEVANQTSLLEQSLNVTNTELSDELHKVAGSFVSTFNPPPTVNVRAMSNCQSQDSSNLPATPINEITHPKTPGTYQGPIRTMGDEIMKALDGELKKTEETEISETQGETANATDDAAAFAHDSKDTGKAPSMREGASSDPPNNDGIVNKTLRQSTRIKPKSNEQTQSIPETTTGDPSTKIGRNAKKKS